jgi:hypothetical protein
LWFHGNWLGTTAQLPPFSVKRMAGKEKLHVYPRRSP